jgi:hypothetical protein
MPHELVRELDEAVRLAEKLAVDLIENYNCVVKFKVAEAPDYFGLKPIILTTVHKRLL